MGATGSQPWKLRFPQTSSGALRTPALRFDALRRATIQEFTWGFKMILHSFARCYYVRL